MNNGNWQEDALKAAKNFRRRMVGKPYRPSSGSEGLDFELDLCTRCRHHSPYVCDLGILAAAFWNDIGDPEYPTQWVYDHEGWPTCTAFEETEDEISSQVPA